MSNVKMQTIDTLILEELLAMPSVTAKYLSQTWGEDKTRVVGWLERFRKLGLCSVTRGGSTRVDRYTGNPEKIREFFCNVP